MIIIFYNYCTMIFCLTWCEMIILGNEIFNLKTELANVNILHGEQYEHGAVVAVWCNNVTLALGEFSVFRKSRAWKEATQAMDDWRESPCLLLPAFGSLWNWLTASFHRQMGNIWWILSDLSSVFPRSLVLSLPRSPSVSVSKTPFVRCTGFLLQWFLLL